MINKSVLALFFFACLLHLNAATAATYKIATISPDGLSWMKKLRAGVKEIESATDGRVKFKIYPGGVQGDDQTVLRKMRIGQLHGGALASGSLTRFFLICRFTIYPCSFSPMKKSIIFAKRWTR